jgi:hypothetical protein
MRPDLRVVARDGQTVPPANRYFSFGVGPAGTVAMVDGKFVQASDAFAAMKAHADRCAEFTLRHIEELIAQRVSENETASTPGGLR